MLARPITAMMPRPYEATLKTDKTARSPCQIVHGSFANTGFEPRLTVNFGFHKRSSVLDVHGAGIHAEAATFDADFIAERSRVMGLAIAARKQKYADETPYDYTPLSAQQSDIQYDAAAQASLLDYNLMDLSI